MTGHCWCTRSWAKLKRFFFIKGFYCLLFTWIGSFVLCSLLLVPHTAPTYNYTHTVHNVHSCSLSTSTSSLSSAKEMASTLQQYCLASGGEANPIFVYNTHPALLMILLCNVQCTNGIIPSKQNNLAKHCSVHLTCEEQSGGGRAANYLCFCLRETCILWIGGGGMWDHYQRPLTMSKSREEEQKQKKAIQRNVLDKESYTWLKINIQLQNEYCDGVTADLIKIIRNN